MKKLFLVPAVVLCLAPVPAASADTGPQCGDVISEQCRANHESRLLRQRANRYRN